MVVVYADVIFFVNFISAAALLYLSSLTVGRRVKLMRIIAASSFSGLYAIFETVFALPYVLRLAVLVCVVTISFGKRGIFINTSRFMLNTILTEAMFMLFGVIIGAKGYLNCGVITVFANEGVGALLYALSFPIVCIVSDIVKRRQKRRIVQMEFGGKCIRKSFVYDSGNFLTHKGVSVAVAAWDTVADVLEFESYEEFSESAKERIIYSTVGKVGVLPAFKPEKCFVDGGECDICVAVSDNGFLHCNGIIGDIKNNHIREESLCNSLKVSQGNLFL